MLNSLPEHHSVKDHLIDNIDSVYSYYLKNYLHDEVIFKYDGFNYTYERRHDPSKSKFVVNFTADLKEVFLDRTGVSWEWKTNITDYAGWKYYDNVVGLPFNSK